MFTHFNNSEFVSEKSYRDADYTVGSLEDILASGKVVVSLSVQEIRDALKENLLDWPQADIEKITNSLKGEF